MLKLYKTLIVLVLISSAITSHSQNDGNKIAEILTWSLVQFIPSPSFYQDNNNDNSGMQFGLKWNLSPVNYSFNANQYVSPVQFFKVNPIRRYGGSIELFVQPEWATSSYKYSDLERFMISPGIRTYVPLIENGEYLSFSAGIKYTFRNSKQNSGKNVFGLELGSYTFFGIVGINFTYNFTNESKYNFSINLKYY